MARIRLADANAQIRQRLLWRELNLPNPCVRTGGVLRHWDEARRRGTPVCSRSAAMSDASLVRPGLIFIIQTNDRGQGHTGLVEGLDGPRLVTLEGNTGPAMGFIDCGPASRI